MTNRYPSLLNNNVVPKNSEVRLAVIEKYLFGETATQAIARLKDPTNGNTKFDKESAAMHGTSIYRHVGPLSGSSYFNCARCHMPLIFNKEGKFEANRDRISDLQLIRLGAAPLEDRCDHKRDPKQPGQTQIFDYTKTLFPDDHYQKL